MLNLTHQTLGAYQIVELLGQGSVAQVYQAYRVGATRQYVALKVFAPEYAPMFQVGQPLYQELKMLTTVTQPHILPLLDFGQVNDYTYLAMPLHRYGNLTKWLPRVPLSVSEIDPLLQQITSALAFAHQRGLVHGALKPSHIFLDEHDNVLLTNFVLAKINPPAARQPTYPESQLTPQSDIYAMGALLYQLVTGDMQAVGVGWQPRQINQPTPTPLEQIILKATALSPTDRYLSIEAMYQVWQQVVPQTVTVATAIQPPPVVVKPQVVPPPPPPPAPPIKKSSTGFSYSAALPWLIAFLLLLAGAVMVLNNMYVALTQQRTAISATATIETIRQADTPPEQLEPTATVLPTITPKATPLPTITPKATTLPTVTPKATILPTVTSKSAILPTVTPKVIATATTVKMAAGSVLVDVACFGSFGFGLSCLDAASWYWISKSNSILKTDLIDDVAICPKPLVLIANSAGLNSFDSEGWLDYKLPKVSLVQGVGCDARGGIWVSYLQGMSYFDGNNWKNYDAMKLVYTPVSLNSVKDMAVATDGTAWFAMFHSVARFDGQEWLVFQIGAGFAHGEDLFNHIALDKQGQPWVLYPNGLTTWNGQQWLNYPSQDSIIATALTVDAQGEVWVGNYNEGLLRFDGQLWHNYNTENSGLTSNYIKSLAADSQGRVWIGTDWGLNVFDGNNWYAYFMWNSDLVDNQIDTMAVAGAGPPLPQVMTHPTGTLQGEIRRNGKVVAEAKVEVCVRELAARFAGVTPCSSQPFSRETTTDATGKFNVADLPPAHYVIAVNIPGEKWYKLSRTNNQILSFRNDERFTVRAGQVTEAYPLYVLELD